MVALGSDWPIAPYDARGVLATAREPLGAAAAGGGLRGIQALEGCTTHAPSPRGRATRRDVSLPGYGRTSRPSASIRGPHRRTSRPRRRYG